MRIGIITALAAEARTMPARRGPLLGNHDYTLVVAGPGQVRAERAAAALVAEGCDALVSWGLAGGLARTHAPGALIVATAVYRDSALALDCDPELQAALYARLAPLGASVAPLYSSVDPIGSVAAKAALHARYGAAAVDLESAAIATVANAHGLRFVAVRSLVDPADFDLPPAALAGMTADGRTRPLATLTRILIHPQELPPLLQLARWYHRALRALAAGAAALCR